MSALVDSKYALFIGGSYGLTLAVLLWNALAPHFRRGELKRRLSEDSAATEEGE
jgi:heme exporter protein CcmD